jgi:hypothetical protein
MTANRLAGAHDPDAELSLISVRYGLLEKKS